MKKGFIIFFMLVSLLGNTQTNIQDSLALVDFYWATGGTNWTNNTNWLAGTVNTWYGITMSTLPGYTDRVSIIALSNNNLNGNLPLSIGDIARLARLTLYNNNISGNLPYTLGRLNRMTILELQNNQFTGSIPDSICRLSNLVILHLSYNMLSGKIPDSLNQITYLYNFIINNNQFDGLPDFSGNSNSINHQVQNNLFTFEDIEPNMVLGCFTCSSCVQYYAPQFDSVNCLIDTTIFLDSSITMLCSIGGQHNIYQWSKDGVDIPFATDSILTLNSVAFVDSGVYSCTITNSIVHGLDFHRRPITVNVVKDVGVTSLQYNDVITVYPNPAKTILFVASKNISAETRFSLYNIFGEKLYEKVSGELSSDIVSFDISKYSNGVYYLHIESGEIIKTQKVVIFNK